MDDAVYVVVFDSEIVRSEIPHPYLTAAIMVFNHTDFMEVEKQTLRKLL